MPTSGASRDLARWSHHWFVAAFLQAQRTITAYAADHTSVGAMETELLMFVDALNNARRGASAAIGSEAEALEWFDQQVPGLKPLRDQLEHHDEYAVGRGRLQKAAGVRPGEQWWTLSLDGATHWADEGPLKHRVRFGLVSKALSGDKLDLREVASVELDLIPSVRAATTLVRAVLETVGIPETPYLVEADQWCSEFELFAPHT